MRRSRPHYGVQGPDALLLFTLLLLLGALGVVLRLLLPLSLALLVSGGIGSGILSLVSSYSYRTNLRDHILKLCPLRGSDAVLDVGTGGGLLAIGLAKLGCRAVGMDIWSSSDLFRNQPARAILNAKLEEVKVSYLTGHALSVPFRESSFDLAVTCDMVHNLHRAREMREIICEMHRVLKRKGKLVIADLNPFLGPFWSRARWVDELRRAGFKRIGIGRLHLTTIISGEKF